ncbi:unnamed protein product [Alternaria alternata]
MNEANTRVGSISAPALRETATLSNANLWGRRRRRKLLLPLPEYDPDDWVVTRPRTPPLRSSSPTLPLTPPPKNEKKVTVLGEGASEAEAEVVKPKRKAKGDDAPPKKKKKAAKEEEKEEKKQKKKKKKKKDKENEPPE